MSHDSTRNVNTSKCRSRWHQQNNWIRLGLSWTNFQFSASGRATQRNQNWVFKREPFFWCHENTKSACDGQYGVLEQIQISKYWFQMQKKSNIILRIWRAVWMIKTEPDCNGLQRSIILGNSLHLACCWRFIRNELRISCFSFFFFNGSSATLYKICNSGRQKNKSLQTEEI